MSELQRPSQLLEVPPCDVSFLIPAAGRGERLGRGPKALLQVDGQPLVLGLAQKASLLSDDVWIAAGPAELEQIKHLCPQAHCIVGGSSRQESVQALVAHAKHPWLLLLDVARPFATTELCRKVLAKAKECGVAGAFLANDIPAARLNDGMLGDVFARGEVGEFQAPQAFSREILENVLAQAQREGWVAQSTMQLVIQAGIRVGVVPGERWNVKLTYPEDWELAPILRNLSAGRADVVDAAPASTLKV